MAIPAFPTGIDLKNKRGINVADPTSATDIANKQYVDNRIDGLSYKDEVRVATTANAALATSYENGDSVDGVTLVTGDRILIKDQTTATENGIYIVGVTGAPTRATDANTTAKLNNATVYVVDGTVNSGREYTQTTKNPTIGTNNLVFVQKSTGTAYTADGQGIELASTTFSIELDGTTLAKSASGLRIGSGAAGAGLTEASGVLAVGQGTGITVAADTVGIDTAVVARIFTANCAATTNPQNFTHSLGKIPAVMILDSAGSVTHPDVVVTTTQVTVDWGSAPAANDYKVVAVG
jgi:hypothetical protein